MVDRVRGALSSAVLSSRPKDILIVGRGVGGLALAAALRRYGAHCRVRILERTAVDWPDRFGITLVVNGLEALDAIGLLDVVSARGHRIDFIEVRRTTASRGARFDYACLGRGVPFGLGFVPSVLIGLLERAVSEDVEILRGHRLVDLAQRAGRVAEVVTEADGREHRFAADVVIGADGTHSQVRRLALPQTTARDNDERYHIMLAGKTTGLQGVLHIVDVGRFLGIMPVCDDRTFLFWLVRPDEMAAARAQSVGEIKAMMTDFAPVAAESLQTIETREQVATLELAWVRSANWHTNNVVLIGDAAHTTTPSMGQGANMAAVDANLLGRLLADWTVAGGGPDVLDAQLERFVELRQRQASFQFELGRLLARFNNEPSQWITGPRPAMLRLITRYAPLRRRVLEYMSGVRPSRSQLSLRE